MSVRRTCDLSDSCALQSLTPEVARADEGSKAADDAEAIEVVEAVAAGARNGTPPERRKTAWAILSMLSGGVTLARSDARRESRGTQIAKAIKTAALAAARA